MTGIHHTAPATYLRATRHEATTITPAARRRSRLVRALRRVADRVPAAGLPRWVDATPASAAR